jgi:YggT family protein
MIWNGITGLTEPVLGPIRRVLPAMSGLDLSPIVLLLGLTLVRGLIVEYVRPYVF